MRHMSKLYQECIINGLITVRSICFHVPEVIKTQYINDEPNREQCVMQRAMGGEPLNERQRVLSHVNQRHRYDTHSLSH